MIGLPHSYGHPDGPMRLVGRVSLGGIYSEVFSQRVEITHVDTSTGTSPRSVQERAARHARRESG